MFSSLRGFMEDLLMNSKLRHLQRGKWPLVAAMIEGKPRLDPEARPISYNIQTVRGISSKANPITQGKGPAVNQCFT